MTPDAPLLAVIGVGIGFLVGLTGVGGGALMTPALVLLGVDPLTAVSSDLVVSLVMKPIGSAVHLRRGTVDRTMVGYLALGSVPAAFAGAFALELLGDTASVKAAVKEMLGAALVLALAGMVLRSWLASRAKVGQSTSGQSTDTGSGPLRYRRTATVLLGVVGGIVVGLTSVGSGSLIIVGLMLLHPQASSRTLVGTDIAQAIPLVASATVGHLLFGSVNFGLAVPLIVGAVPAVYLGARVSSSGRLDVVRPIVMLLVGLSAAQLLGASPTLLGALIVAVATGFGAVRLIGPRRAARRNTAESFA